MPHTRPVVIAFMAASIFSFVICLPHEVVCTSGGCGGGWNGFLVAAFGWVELLGIGRASLVVVLSWFANPALWAAWGLLFGRLYFGAAVASLVAVLLALGYKTGAQILTSASGAADTISGVGPGYWAWVVSMGLAFAAALIGLMESVGAKAMTVGRRTARRGRPR